jgi:hypothetical protein
LTRGVFVSDEQLLDVSFTTARARLANLTRSRALGAAADDAYSSEMIGLAQAQPVAFAPGMCRLTQVQVHELKAGGGSARLALRWQVSRPGGGLFPVLDADITLTAAGEHATNLMLAGAYRHPPGTVSAGHDRAAWHPMAAATIRAFLNHITEAISHAAPATKPGTRSRGSASWTQRPPPGESSYEKNGQG